MISTMRVGPGAAPKALIYSLRVFGCAGSTNLTSEALECAVDPDGNGDFSDHLDVVNMSLGSPFGTADDPEVEAVNAMAQAGTVIVSSAGNNGQNGNNGR